MLGCSRETELTTPFAHTVWSLWFHITNWTIRWLILEDPDLEIHCSVRWGRWMHSQILHKYMIAEVVGRALSSAD